MKLDSPALVFGCLALICGAIVVGTFAAVGIYNVLYDPVQNLTGAAIIFAVLTMFAPLGALFGFIYIAISIVNPAKNGKAMTWRK